MMLFATMGASTSISLGQLRLESLHVCDKEKGVEGILKFEGECRRTFRGVHLTPITLISPDACGERRPQNKRLVLERWDASRL